MHVNYRQLSFRRTSLSHAPRQRRHPFRERGVSLFVILVFVMLTMLLAIWASRASYVNELLVGNDADYQRAFAAAHALIQDAELDIEGATSDGTLCEPDPGDTDICRHATPEKIPKDDQELAALLDHLGALASEAPRCRNGLCLKRADRATNKDKQDFWNNNDADAGITLAQMTGTHEDKSPVGARFGQYTGARPGSDDEPANPLLRERSDGKGGWYWIEVLPYVDKLGAEVIVGSPQYLEINQKPSVVYRITALVYGRKPNTRVVLQQTYAQQKFKN